ncbi:MAG TPA: hypothetical protein VIU61_23950 [Kofleriaceae bacterium]
MEDLDGLDLPRAELRAAAEAADPASWARIVRWAHQIARTGSDPAPLVKVLRQLAHPFPS